MDHPAYPWQPAENWYQLIHDINVGGGGRAIWNPAANPVAGFHMPIYNPQALPPPAAPIQPVYTFTFGDPLFRNVYNGDPEWNQTMRRLDEMRKANEVIAARNAELLEAQHGQAARIENLREDAAAAQRLINQIAAAAAPQANVRDEADADEDIVEAQQLPRHLQIFEEMRRAVRVPDPRAVAWGAQLAAYNLRPLFPAPAALQAPVRVEAAHADADDDNHDVDEPQPVPPPPQHVLDNLQPPQLQQQRHQQPPQNQDPEFLRMVAEGQRALQERRLDAWLRDVQPHLHADADIRVGAGADPVLNEPADIDLWRAEVAARHQLPVPGAPQAPLRIEEADAQDAQAVALPLLQRLPAPLAARRQVDVRNEADRQGAAAAVAAVHPQLGRLHDAAEILEAIEAARRRAAHIIPAAEHPDGWAAAERRAAVAAAHPALQHLFLEDGDIADDSGSEGSDDNDEVQWLDPEGAAADADNDDDDDEALAQRLQQEEWDEEDRAEEEADRRWQHQMHGNGAMQRADDVMRNVRAFLNGDDAEMGDEDNVNNHFNWPAFNIDGFFGEEGEDVPRLVPLPAQQQTAAAKAARVQELREEDESDESVALVYTRACTICLTPNPRKRAVLVPCGHMFCLACVEHQSDGNRQLDCSTCRARCTYVRCFEDEDTSKLNQQEESENETRKRQNDDREGPCSSSKRQCTSPFLDYQI